MKQRQRVISDMEGHCCITSVLTEAPSTNPIQDERTAEERDIEEEVLSGDSLNDGGHFASPEEMGENL